MKRSFVFLFGVILFCSLPACAEQYGLKSFNKSFKKVTSVAEAVELCRDYMDHAEKMADLRSFQDEWLVISPESARQYALAKMQAQPESREAKYLYSRVCNQPAEALRIGRELVAENPDWLYGYMTVTHNYSIAFDSVGRADPFWKDIEKDSICFQRLIELWSDPNPLYCYYKYQIFMGDFAGAIETHERYEKVGGRPQADDDFALVLVQAGQYQRAQEAVDKELKSQRYKDAEFNRLSHNWFLRRLFLAGAYSQLIDYVQSNNLFDSLPGYMCSYMAAVYSSENNRDSVFHYLQCAADRGYAPPYDENQDSIFATFTDDPRWSVYIAQCIENREADIAQGIIPDDQKQPAPDFQFEDANGNLVSLADYRGKIVVINFWIIWCGFCEKAHPYVSEFAQQQDTNAVQVLSIQIPSDNDNRIKSIGKFQGNHYAMKLLFGDDKIQDRYEFDGYPTFFIIDQDGFIRYRTSGFSKDYSPRKFDFIIKSLQS